MDKAESRSRFVGSLLGTAFGDALGASVEMQSRSKVQSQFGQVRDFLPHTRGFGRYTDDTEMTLAQARSLIDRGGSMLQIAHAAMRKRLVWRGVTVEVRFRLWKHWWKEPTVGRPAPCFSRKVFSATVPS